MPFTRGREKEILGARLKSFCAGNIVDDVTVIRSFSVSQSAVCSLRSAVCSLQSANVRHRAVTCSLFKMFKRQRLRDKRSNSMQNRKYSAQDLAHRATMYILSIKLFYNVYYF